MHVGLCLYDPGRADYSSPLKLFDYLASGLAVCATEQPQVRCVLTQMGYPDMLVRHGDVWHLVAILLRFAEEPETARRMGAAGRRLVIEHYNWRRAIRDAYAAIDSVRADGAVVER